MSARRPMVLTGCMTRSSAHIPLLATAASAIALTALTGCAPILDTLQNESTSSYSSTSEIVEGWAKKAPWLPDDATAIRVRETPDAEPAVLLATSETDLDPAVCVEVERQSAPVFGVDGAPDPFVDRVFACGDWAVMKTDDGWYGWTPNHPEEKAASDVIS